MNSKSVLRIILKTHSFRTYLFFLLTLLFFYNGLLQAQWVQAGLEGKDIYSLAVSGSNIFAGSDSGLVYLSTDNGISWTTVNNGLPNNAIFALLTYENSIFAGTDGAGGYLSTNNGATWTHLNDSMGTINMFAVNGSIIFEGGKGVSRSTDNGMTWTKVNNGLTNTQAITSLVFNDNIIFAGTYIRGVFLSTNNGEYWTEANNGLTYPQVLALGVCGTNIFAGTKGDGVYRSTNNGTSWTQLNSGLALPVIVYCFGVNGNNIFAGMDYYNILLSTDNGTNWAHVMDTKPNSAVLAIDFCGTDVFVSLGHQGVWRRPLSEIVGVSKEVNNLPTAYSVSQNYPNPFNPSTTINYSLAREEKVKLFVFNTLGQIVKVLENGYKNAGNYTVTFNATDLPSGIYFYRLEAGQFTQVRKMILLK
jgi:photosystem II stability/assembly factor-like uncharacterized protein